MPLSRMENTTFAMPSIIDSHDMGLRTVYSPDAQKKTPIQRHLLPAKFVENLKGISRVTGPLTTKEFEQAETFLVKKVQEQKFSSDINNLKTVHIELVSDLTSQAFIAALKMFMARRGKCAKLFSDNGKNFVGASNEIKKTP
ncbi:integrase catalytic domain-containing protein [Trichonephila clavipes]|nr:integrase catalytic domain-containing protein [Trichonephila clavipes]